MIRNSGIGNEPDYRGRLKSDKNGDFSFKVIRPVPYPIPHDGNFSLS